MRFDITVIGGGLAGVNAAIAAARLGSRVALVQNRPVLGGNSSSEVRVWVCGASAHGSQKYARETGIMGELFVENQYRNPEGNPYFWDQVVHDAVRAETNIELFLNTDVREVDASGPDDDRRIHSVTGWQMGSEKVLTFESDMFVDCTGDGLVGFLAGAHFRSGREARSEFGEEWAPEEPDDDMLGSTLLFYTKDAGQPVRYVPPSIAKDIAATSILRNRQIRATDNGCDYWWIEWGGELDAVADNESIRDELWAVVYGIWDHIKNSGEYDAENLTLEWVGSVPGKREYRRFVGDYTLTQHDIIAQRPFDDRVGFGGWSIDLHPPGGMYADAPGSRHLFSSGVYHIPFRSLYSRNVGNMLMAGRNISATHVAFGTTRVMATCAVTGEAAGTGAALAVREGLTPRRLVADHPQLLRNTLLRQDASAVGVPWTDPADLAHTARASASSTLTDLSVEPDGSGPVELFALEGRDLGIVLPQEPAVGALELLIDSTAETTAHVELWTTDRGENHIPVRLLEERVVPVAVGRHWVPLPFEHASVAAENGSVTAENLVLLVRRHDDLSVVVEDRPGPYGILGLVSRQPRFTAAQNDRHPQTNAWSARELRRTSIALRVHGATAAYAPAKVQGGHARPFGGPQLWSSERTVEGRPEWVQLEWAEPQDIGSVDLLFNDDVDVDLVNLHHHRTPFAVIPELVRDYRIEAETPSGRTTIATVAGNRRRHRRHEFAEPVRATRLRVIVEATNGSEWATVHGIRVFSPVS
ncbi:FAD-dependent oxidoreductase [Microbacterium sp. 179-I 3D2 NHS]|uniref:FAD-dependent oxidoreductase n=1 Tax=Microbacterium sp. 179-I 3D2 NHS TaxID=3235178 RepID=UPI0039A16017